MRRNLSSVILSCFLTALSLPSAAQLPSSGVTTYAGTRWWWMGSAVDSLNLEWNLAELRDRHKNRRDNTALRCERQ